MKRISTCQLRPCRLRTRFIINSAEQIQNNTISMWRNSRFL